MRRKIFHKKIVTPHRKTSNISSCMSGQLKIFRYKPILYLVLLICFWNFFQNIGHALGREHSSEHSVKISSSFEKISEHTSNAQPCSQDCDDENCSSHHCHFGHCQTLNTRPFQFHSPQFLFTSFSPEKSESYSLMPHALIRPPKSSLI